MGLPTRNLRWGPSAELSNDLFYLANNEVGTAELRLGEQRLNPSPGRRLAGSQELLRDLADRFLKPARVPCTHLLPIRGTPRDEFAPQIGKQHAKVAPADISAGRDRVC